MLLMKSERGILFVTGCIIITEFCERLAYYGLAGNLELFFKSEMDMSTADASLHVTLFAGTVYCTPLLGGWLADSYLNRFRTILIFQVIYLVGLCGISLASWVFSHESNNKDEIPLGFAIIFWVGLYLIALGTGKCWIV